MAELEQEPNMPAGHLAGLFNAQGPQRQLPDGLRRQQPGDRRGDRDHPPRRRRRDALRRHPQHDPPVRRHGFQPADRAFERNDEPERARRGRSTCTATGSCSAKAPRWSCSRNSSTPRSAARTIYGEIAGYGSTADAYRITDTHPEGRGAARCMTMALDDAGLNPDRDRLHQRPRHQHRRQRPRRDAGDQQGLRRAGLQDPGLQHQEHDGPPDRAPPGPRS